MQFVGQFGDCEFLQFDDVAFISREPLSQLVAGRSFFSFHLAESFDEEHKRGRVVSVGLELLEALLQLGVVELVVMFIEEGGVGEGGCVEAGESH
jgi:hypothetical protein